MRLLVLVGVVVVVLATPRFAISAASRRIETVAGDGTPGFSAAQVHDVLGLVMGPDGALYFSDSGNHVIRRLDLKTHLLSTVAGNGKDGTGGDGGPATAATLNQPYEIQFDSAGNLYIADTPSHVIRKVDAKTRSIATLAGTGKPGFDGDGAPAVNAQLNRPSGLAFAQDGSLLICDTGNNRIRRIDLRTGLIGTFAGTGERKPTPEDAPIQGTPLSAPRTMAVGPNGDIYLALPTAIYRIDMRAQRLRHVAGKGGDPGLVNYDPVRPRKLACQRLPVWTHGDAGIMAADAIVTTLPRTGNS
ncbi:MAG TPA: hypothetical protein VGX46_15925, partial [Vicinamibacterales bacterium]|nr:hypothetical protein [Vicinamibacterales bacterium]